MQVFLYRVFALMLIFLLSSSANFAQTARILELDNSKAYQLIERFVESGNFKGLNPTKLPYTHYEVYQELQKIEFLKLSKIEQIWYSQLKDEIRYSAELEDKEYIFEPYVLTGSEFNNSERKNTYRPTNENYYVWPFTDLAFVADYKNFTVNTNIRFDLYNEFGPDGLDPANRLYIRNEDSYVGFSSKYFSAYLGRLETNWGLEGEKSTFISTNPPTFDQLSYTIGTNRISFTSLNGFLDNISGDGVYRGNTIDDLIAKRRYLSLKRIDWRVSDHISIGFKEAILYSGINVNIEPKYMVPGFVFFFLEAASPRDQVENLLLGANLWYNKNGLTFNIDFMLDDLIFNREERGITERNNFSFIFNSSYKTKNAPIAINWDLELITYQAYNTDQAEGRFIYLNRGLATDFNDYIFTEIGLEYYADLKVNGLTLAPYIGILKQGEQKINQTFNSSYPNGEALEIVLTGIVETTTRLGLDVYYSPVNFFWLKLDMGYNKVENFMNVEGRNANRFVGMAEIGLKYNFKL